MPLFSKKKPKGPTKRSVSFISINGADPLKAILSVAREACRAHLVAGSWRVADQGQQKSGSYWTTITYGLTSPHGSAYNLEYRLETAWRPGDPYFVNVKIGTADGS